MVSRCGFMVVRRGILFCERPQSPATACFWHQRLLSSRRARSPAGTVVRWTGLFAFLSHSRWTSSFDSSFFRSRLPVILSAPAWPDDGKCPVLVGWSNSAGLGLLIGDHLKNLVAPNRGCLLVNLPAGTRTRAIYFREIIVASKLTSCPHGLPPGDTFDLPSHDSAIARVFRRSEATYP